MELIKRINSASDSQCPPAESELLTKVFCTHQALKKPVADAGLFQRLLREPQSALHQFVQQHLVAGQWLLKGNGYRLKLELPTDEHGMPFSHYTPVQQLRFTDPYYQPPVPNPVMTLASSARDRAGLVVGQF